MRVELKVPARLAAHMAPGTNVPIARARVLARLAEAALRPVTVMLAPAGCGKTIALGQYLAQLQAPHVRYDVRAEHGTLLGFVRGFADVLVDIAPGARASVADAVASAMATDDPGTLLALWMSKHLPHFAGVIAIDDLHHTESDKRCAEFIAALIERTKSATRWILASRSASHLPIGSWVVYGDCDVPVNENDLRFTALEAQDAAEHSRSSLDESDIERLLQTTAGWATAFTLALRVSEYSPDLQSAAATARQLSYEYLAEHVYRLLSPDERALLSVSALLPEIDVEVLERAGFDRAHAMVEELQRRLNFISTLGPRRYRCHDLFRAFLEHQLELQGEEASHVAQLKAARALRVCGRIIPALQLFAKSHADVQVLELLDLHGFQLVEQAHADAVQSAIDSLEENNRRSHPVVLGLRAQLERAAGRYDKAKPLFERAIAAARETRLRAILIAKLSGTLLNLGESPTELLEQATRDNELPVSLQGELLSLLAVSYARFGKHTGLDRLLERVEGLVPQLDSDIGRAMLLHQLGSAAVLHGDAPRASRTLEGAATLATQNGMFRLASLVYTSLGSNAVMNQDDLPKALVAARHAADTAVKSGELFLARYALARQMDIEVHCGNSERVHELLRAYAELSGPEHPQLLKAIGWARAMLAAWDGRFNEAAKFEGEVCRGPLFAEERMRSLAFCALFQIAAGFREEALSYVEEALSESKNAASPRPYFARSREIVRSLCALTEALAGRITAANRLLQRKTVIQTNVTGALAACVAQIVRSMQIGMTQHHDLEAHFAILRKEWHGGYVRMLQAILAHQATKRAGDVALTPTELAVFRALAAGATPKEIALSTNCSIHTVRWHIRQAVAKFGCSGREQALRAAVARGLL